MSKTLDGVIRSWNDGARRLKGYSEEEIVGRSASLFYTEQDIRARTLEREMETVQQDLKMVEARYGDDVLHLVIASGYLSKLLNNKDIRRYLSQHHPEILAEFMAIVSATSLDQTASAV